ncbi:hypothetical protein CDAR_413481 [Caerostris darwini]|uniref:Uncharacterized protein n=1 Tax=Caerostris darwini TaxID=1538125 RepID=A0AAV4S7C7_9ARAC|nr:hypothetical protein CDAR_413481 [Caerostris darwini]
MDSHLITHSIRHRNYGRVYRRMRSVFKSGPKGNGLFSGSPAQLARNPRGPTKSNYAALLVVFFNYETDFPTGSKRKDPPLRRTKISREDSSRLCLDAA